MELTTDINLTETQAGALSRLFVENRVACQNLVQKDYGALLENSLQTYFPFNAQMWNEIENNVLKENELNRDPVELLKIIEGFSPILLNRDLASLSLLRAGEYTAARHDKVTSMLVYDDEEMLSIGLEATVALSNWQMWRFGLSKWFSSERFLNIVYQGLEQPAFAEWAAFGFYWLLEISRQDVMPKEDAQQILRSIAPLLEKGAEQTRDSNLAFCCHLALNPAIRVQFE